MEESQETKRRNLEIDISMAIQEAFHVFIRENPDWYDDVDWKNPKPFIALCCKQTQL